MKKQIQMLKRILENQKTLLDHLQMIIYNQHSNGKKEFVVNERNLKEIERKYNL